MKQDQSKKEVKKLCDKNTKKDFYLTVISFVKKGNSLAQVCKKLNITKQRLNYYIKPLKDINVIYKIGYGVWGINETKLEEVKKLPCNNIKDGLKVEVKDNYFDKRLHATRWKVNLSDIPNWHKREQFLIKKNIPYKLVGIKKNTQSVKLNGFTIWLANKSLVIYSKKEYTKKEALETLKQATKDLLLLLRLIENKFKISLKIDGVYKFRLVRSQLSILNSPFAQMLEKEGIKLRVLNEGGKEWFLADKSKGINEDELTNLKTNFNDAEGWENILNSNRRTGYKVTAEFILERFNDILNLGQYYGENLTSHVQAIKELTEGIKEFRKEIKKSK